MKMIRYQRECEARLFRKTGVADQIVRSVFFA
jgi:hypothetical protein